MSQIKKAGFLCHGLYLKWDIFASPNIRGFVSDKHMGIILANFNFRGRQRLRKIILILFRENRRVGGTTLLSLSRSTEEKSPAKLSETQENKR